MDKSVIIKSNKHGLILNLDADLSFDELCNKLNDKFCESSKFFGNVKMALTIEGRTLSSSEMNKVIDIISNTTDIEILAVIDNSEVNDHLFQNQIKKVFRELDASAAEIYPFSVEDNMKLEFQRSVIILGNVEKNAEVHTDGSVFILGSLLGSVYAGELGNTDAKVFANILKPTAVCIADIPYKTVRKNKNKKRVLFGRRQSGDCSEYNSVLLYLDEGSVISTQFITDETTD